MTSHDYLIKNLPSTVMITLSTENKDIIQYNYWNYFHQKFEFHLLKDDFSVGHILHVGTAKIHEDGSVIFESNYHPKTVVLNFYFGGVNESQNI